MKSSNKKITTILLIISLIITIVGITYAFVSQVLTGEKEIVINAGVLDLVLEEENAITISDALPMHDAVGMIQEDVFVFRLVNKTSNPTNYILKLSKIDATNELHPSDVKYYLTKEGVGEPKLLSSLPSDGTVDSGTIAGNDTIDYTLRLWIDSAVTDEIKISGKTLSYRINAEVSQEITKASFIDELENKVQESTSTFPNFSRISSAANGRGIYKYQEDGEDIYYWRGAVDQVEGTANHVIFGDYCWEMVRTTKTGGIKIIYDGVPAEVDGKKTCSNTGTASALSVGYVEFNSGYDDNAYIGYMYGLTGVTAELSSAQCIKLNKAGTKAEIGTETTETECTANGGKWVKTAYEATHANIVNSTIKGVIDTWFEESGLNTEENLEKLEDAVYCNDRSIDINAGGNYTTLGYGKKPTAYMTPNRIYDNKKPSLECKNVNDRFTVSKENGNGDLTYPVGLLTGDEILLAGGVNGSSNNDFYLYTGEEYWSLSPCVFFNYPYLLFLNNYGNPINEDVSFSNEVRPVVSLVSGTTFASGGEGTVSNPYITQ